MSYSFLGLVPCGNSRAVVGGAGIGAVLERLAELHVEVARAEQSGEQQALDAPPSCGETLLLTLEYKIKGKRLRDALPSF